MNHGCLYCSWLWVGVTSFVYADKAVGQKIQPFWIETEARKIKGTKFKVKAPFTPYAIKDGNLITGQQQASGAAAAKLVLQSLK